MSKKSRENQSIDEFDQFPIEENWEFQDPKMEAYFLGLCKGISP